MIRMLWLLIVAAGAFRIPSARELDGVVNTNPGAAIDTGTGRVVPLDHRVPFSRIDTTSCQPDFFQTFSNPTKKSVTFECAFSFTRQPVTVRVDVFGAFTSASVGFRQLEFEPYQVNKYASSLMGYSNLFLETEDFDYNNNYILATVAVPVNESIIRPADIAQLPETFHVTFSNLKTERYSSLVGATASNMYYAPTGNSSAMLVFEVNMAEGDNQFSAFQTRNPESINGIQQLTTGDTAHLAVDYSAFAIGIVGFFIGVTAIFLAVYALRKTRNNELEDTAREDRLRRRLDTLESNVGGSQYVSGTQIPRGSNPRHILHHQ